MFGLGKHTPKPQAVIQKITADAVFPSYGSEQSAYMDLSVIESAVMYAGETKVFRTGLKVQTPPDHYLEIVSRSGLSKEGLTVANAPAIIDPDYRGEILVILKADRRINVEAYTRVAQMQFVKISDVEITEGLVPLDTERGDQGLGSTGT